MSAAPTGLHPVHTDLVVSTSFFEKEIIFEYWGVLVVVLTLFGGLLCYGEVLWKVRLGGKKACTREGRVKTRIS